jgi:hypothetical protein
LNQARIGEGAGPELTVCGWDPPRAEPRCETPTRALASGAGAEAYERMLAFDVRYRFVIDIASLKGA